MATREIRLTQADVAACDVCGRTLLRGERAHPYLEGDEPRLVCELCTGRAAREGWLREGASPVYGGRKGGADRRRSLLGRLRREVEVKLASEPDDAAPPAEHGRRPAPLPRRRPSEPRHVRAVPAGLEQRIAAAVEAFNGSQAPRTVAGVTRSLGFPSVHIRPDATRPSLVFVTVAWELSWYRYEVDLADEDEPVRVGSQGSELDELPPQERESNATCAENGLLALPG
jgi:hypothetical protein